MKECNRPECNQPLTGRQTKYCSEKCRLIVSNSKFQNYKEQLKRGFERKLQAVNEKGGCCSVCGYNRNLAALCFHHLRDKLFNLDFRGFSNRKEKAILEELDKCILLCHNCHHEIHNPNYFITPDMMVGAVGFEPTSSP